MNLQITKKLNVIDGETLMDARLPKRNFCVETLLPEGISMLGGAPRSDVINVVLCRQFYRNPSTVRQSVLLSQNGSSRAKYGFLCTRSPQTPTYAFAHLAPEKHYQYFS